MLPYSEKPVNLAHSGAVIPVRIGVPEWPPIDTMGMLDTGAYRSLIHTDLVAQLALIPAGRALITTVTAEVFECPTYRVRFGFPQSVYVDVVAASSTWLGKEYMCIIGRDALRHGMLMYNGLTNSFALIF